MSELEKINLSDLDGINPALTRYGRQEPAPVLPLREEPDLLSWLETVSYTHLTLPTILRV